MSTVNSVLYYTNLQSKPANSPDNNYQRINALVSQIGKQTQMPTYSRNYCIFNEPLVNELVQQREKAVPPVTQLLNTVSDEKTVTEGLYVLDRMIEAGVDIDMTNTYPVLSRFNNTNSPDIQVMLAGIYRKTQVPDGFGPLCKMLIRDSLLPQNPYPFDPTEEIGGAILEYVRNKGAVSQYSKT